MAKYVDQFHRRVDEYLASKMRLGSLVGLATCRARTRRKAPTMIDLSFTAQKTTISRPAKLRRLLLPTGIDIDNHSSTMWIIYFAVTVLLIRIRTTPFELLTISP